MNILLLPSLLTLTIIALRKLNKQKPDYCIYALVFFSILIFDLLLPSKAKGVDFVPDAKMEISMMKEFDMLTHQERKYYMDKIEFHDANGKRTYADAKNKCWFLPEVSDRDKARWCFSTFVAGIAAGTPMSKVVAMILNALANYGLNCIDEWEYIQNKLHWSEYHFEMKEWYENVLING
jgi:hypothetical protein